MASADEPSTDEPSTADFENEVASEELYNDECRNSFTPTTRVLLASGKFIPISRLKVGDKVLAFSTRTGRDQAETVTAVLVNHDTDLYNLTVKTKSGNEVIHTTSNHLLWDPYPHYGWIPAKDLKPGERLKTADGTLAIVVGGSTPKVRVGWMWDLTVPGNNDHDFYVVSGSASALVHNESCPVDLPDPGLLKIEASNPSASEVSAAEYMAGQGNRVLLRDPVGPRGSATSDLLVNGEQWDVYTPTTGNASRFVSAVASKGSQVRGGGVIIDLSQSSVTADQLANIQARIAGTGRQGKHSAHSRGVMGGVVFG